MYKFVIIKDNPMNEIGSLSSVEPLLDYFKKRGYAKKADLKIIKNLIILVFINP